MVFDNQLHVGLTAVSSSVDAASGNFIAAYGIAGAPVIQAIVSPVAVTGLNFTGANVTVDLNNSYVRLSDSNGHAIIATGGNLNANIFSSAGANIQSTSGLLNVVDSSTLNCYVANAVDVNVISSITMPVDVVASIPLNVTGLANVSFSINSTNPLPVAVKSFNPYTELGNLIGIGPKPYGTPTDYAWASNFQIDANGELVDGNVYDGSVASKFRRRRV